MKNQDKLKEQFFDWRKRLIKKGELKKNAGRDTCFPLVKKCKVSGIGYEKWMESVTYNLIRHWFEIPKEKKITLADTQQQISVTDILNEEDYDIVAENMKLAKKVQKLQDSNRIERKAFRNQARLYNALENYNKEVIKLLKNYNLCNYTIQHEANDNKACGLVQLSDVHFNELIDILGNKYDFTVAAKRLKKLAMKTKQYFNLHGIRNVLLALTGDMLNSDRRIDEIFNQASNRANASILSLILLIQFIRDLNEDFNVTIASVSGNESRIHKELGYSNYVATNNYDFTIDNFLRIIFNNCKGISFVDGDAFEKVVTISGQNVLITHGLDLQRGATQNAIQAKIGGYALKGIIIDYVIYGHVHCPNVSNHSARSSSLAGSNDYNEKALNLIGRASQNIYIFYDDKTRDAIVIDLQNVNNIKGYNVEKELEAYHTKSASKTKQSTVIFQVVV